MRRTCLDILSTFLTDAGPPPPECISVFCQQKRVRLFILSAFKDYFDFIFLSEFFFRHERVLHLWAVFFADFIVWMTGKKMLQNCVIGRQNPNYKLKSILKNHHKWQKFGKKWRKAVFNLRSKLSKPLVIKNNFRIVARWRQCNFFFVSDWAWYFYFFVKSITRNIVVIYCFYAKE